MTETISQAKQLVEERIEFLNKITEGIEELDIFLLHDENERIYKEIIGMINGHLDDAVKQEKILKKYLSAKHE